MAPQLIKTYVEVGKLRIVWHDFTWIGQESRQAAQAARCAGKQSKFWPYHDYLYANQRGYNQGHFSVANLKQFAMIVGLEASEFDACLDAGGDLATIQQELSAGREQGITATPAFNLNGQRLVGALDFATFARAIDAALAR